MEGFIQLKRGEMTEDLLSRPNEFTLLSIIAYRARRNDSKVKDLKPGQAMIGDYKNYGMTRATYRHAIYNLQRYGLVTTQATNKGTIATLINKEVYDINESSATNKATTQQPSTQPPSNHPHNHPATTNEEWNKGKNERMEEGNKNGEQQKPVPREPVPYEKIFAMYHDICNMLPKVKVKTDSRKQAVRNRYNQFKDHEKGPLWPIEVAFGKVAESDFLSGRSGKWTKCNFDWIMKQSNFVKIVEGNYDND